MSERNDKKGRKEMQVVGIGACVVDTLITVPSYPKEDSKQRALSVKTAGGGPAATGVVAAARLGTSAGYIGVLADDGGGRFLKEDFEKYGVDTTCVEMRRGFRSFSSTIWLAQDRATRTCVFDKGNLPPLVLDWAKEEAVAGARVLLVDGNEMDAAQEACRIARRRNTKVLYDCGGLYQGVERLLSLTDVMIPSEEFALEHTGCDTVMAAAQRLYAQYRPEAVIVTCGKKGGIFYDGNKSRQYPAFSVNAVDTNGSGDVFHGAFAAGMVRGFDYWKCCCFASAVSALKCMGVGARESIPDIEHTFEFLDRHGYAGFVAAQTCPDCCEGFEGEERLQNELFAGD